jgi:hypothetical protein
MARSGTLDRRHRRALEALLRAPTVTAAAAASGIGRRTLFRYLADPAFRAAYRSERTVAIGQATALLAAFSGGVVARLLRQADSADPAVSQPALRTLLAFAFHAAASADVEERVSELEARLVRRDDAAAPLHVVPKRRLA